MKNNVNGFADWDYYYCKLNGEGHCVLFKGGKVIDCNIKEVVTEESYKSIYNITDFRKYNWFVVLSKIIVAKVYLWIN